MSEQTSRVIPWGVGAEIRLNVDGSIDEIVASNLSHFHLEQMDTGAWWLGIEKSNGEMLRIDLIARRRSIRCTAYDDDGTIEEGFKK